MRPEEDKTSLENVLWNKPGTMARRLSDENYRAMRPIPKEITLRRGRGGQGTFS